MPAIRDFAFEIRFPGKEAEVASEAIAVWCQHEEGGTLPGIGQKDASFSELFPNAPDNTAPAVAAFAEALFCSICHHANTTQDLSLATLCCNPYQRRPGDPVVLSIQTEHEGWVSTETITGIVRACQDELGAGPVAWIHHDNIYGERSEGAVYVPPGGKAECFDLDSWIRKKLEGHDAAAAQQLETTRQAVAENQDITPYSPLP